jgi:glutamyl-tRNA(Gln) amidotransferase subunit D
MPNIGGGYKGAGLEFLSSHGLSIGDSVLFTTKDGELAGVIMPRYESASDQYIVIKLKSGYNVGIRIPKIMSVTKLPRKVEANPSPTGSRIRENNNLPRIALISTGGTIASKVDYRTGGVHAALSAAELYESVPELATHVSVDAEVLLSEYSENLKPSHWTMISNRIAEMVKTGKYTGILVSHGTDTLHYTAAALSFALQNLPIPVVLVGAQRSSDRPSSDAALNLLAAVIFAAKAQAAGVFVAMHAGMSDDIIAIHVGTRVRKNHTSRRDAFESIDVTPVAQVKNGEIEMNESEIKLHPRSTSTDDLQVKADFDDRVMLLKFYPGFDSRIIEHVTRAGYKAIILEGTGLGHINKDCFPALRKAIEAGIVIYMTSQCIWGRVRMTVYDTGRDLLGIGVIPLSDMISETGTVKAMWALANADAKSMKEVMQTNIANEMSSSIPIS